MIPVLPGKLAGNSLPPPATVGLTPAPPIPCRESMSHQVASALVAARHAATLELPIVSGGSSGPANCRRPGPDRGGTRGGRAPALVAEAAPRSGGAAPPAGPGP